MGKSKKVSVSVLVPVYNAGKYLQQCLDSILAQTLRGLEVICINDGSTDASLKILQRYAANDPRIRVLDKPNSGYGDSMNRGLAVARGEYIGIVEPDDYIDPAMFETLYNLATKHRADLVRGNYYYHTDGGGDVLHHNVPAKFAAALDGRNLTMGVSVRPADYPDLFLAEPAIWSGIYRREFLAESKIQFLPTPGAAYQDTSFFFKTMAMAKRAAFSGAAHLHYRVDNNTSSVKSIDKIFAVSAEYAEIERFLKLHRMYNSGPALGYVMQAAKFGAYHWNLLRLPDAEMRKFVPQMRKEFWQARRDKMLRRSVFPRAYWLSLKALFYTPRAIYAKGVAFYRGRVRSVPIVSMIKVK